MGELTAADAWEIAFSIYIMVAAVWLIVSAIGTALDEQDTFPGGRKAMARGVLTFPIWPLIVAAVAIGMIAWAIAYVWRTAFPR
jgi:hypothetical protein